jgi:hypothetical protein
VSTMYAPGISAAPSRDWDPFIAFTIGSLDRVRVGFPYVKDRITLAAYLSARLNLHIHQEVERYGTLVRASDGCLDPRVNPRCDAAHLFAGSARSQQRPWVAAGRAKPWIMSTWCESEPSGRSNERNLRSFLRRSPLPMSNVRIPPESVSPAAMVLGRSAREAPSFSIISTAA